MRVLPFFIALAGAILYALGWMGSQGILQGGNRELLGILWGNRPRLLVVVGASVLLYLFMIFISRTSFVEARPKALHVRAGLVPVDISYGRIRQIRLVQLGLQYPPETLKGPEVGLIDPLAGATCTVVDLSSVPWPFTKRSLRWIWNKFMFTADGGSLMFVVKDAMVLNQQIDSYLAARQARLKGDDRYLDPIARATRAQQQRARQSKPTRK
jgi:hypothetical protein